MKIFTPGKTIIFALSLGAFFGATAARAQDYSVRVDVPFQFVAGEKLYPAGDYKFTVNRSVHTLTIQSQADTKIHMVPITPSTARRSGHVMDGMVRFTKAGNSHVLNGVWKAGSMDGSVTYPSKAVKEGQASAGN